MEDRTEIEMKFENKRLLGLEIGAALVLLIPLTAMRLDAGFKWSWFDFAIAGTLLLGTGLMCELVLRKVRKFEYRLALVGVILFALFIIWAELAVGLIGTPLAGS